MGVADEADLLMACGYSDSWVVPVNENQEISHDEGSGGAVMLLAVVWKHSLNQVRARLFSCLQDCEICDGMV